MSQNRQKISAFVICKDEEKYIRQCLDSICWCDEILVIDSGSTDRTLEYAAEYKNVRIIKKDWPGHREQKVYGLAQCQYPWVFNIDADEEVSPELKDSIIEVLKQDLMGSVPEGGFEICRVVFFHGRWWNKGGWYPEYKLRLLRRSTASWGGWSAHEKAIVSGTVARIKGDLYHYTYENITDMINTSNHFSSIAAQEMSHRGKRFRLIDIIFRPFIAFFRFYIAKGGYREGFSGIIIAIFQGIYTFMKYAKLWEVELLNKIKK
jgi:glycosyltransferase involved in cell wall biosynthesis